MFYRCASLTSLDLSNFDTGNVTDVRGMFEYCLTLTSLDLSGADFSKVISANRRNMFTSTNSSLIVTVKDAAAQSFIQARGIPVTRIVIA